MSQMKKTTSVNMTEGSIVRRVLLFSLPLMLGNVFQMLYNTVDMVVVGNFVGKEALGAVGGSTGTLINLLIPIPKITAGFAALCRQDPESVPGRILGNIPACLIFVVVIGLVMNLYNVRKVPDFLFAFIGTFLPMYLVCFVVALIFMPIAVKAATAADGR